MSLQLQAVARRRHLRQLLKFRVQHNSGVTIYVMNTHITTEEVSLVPCSVPLSSRLFLIEVISISRIT
jgi:hypothetical protein